MIVIDRNSPPEDYRQAAHRLREADKVLALTGAGISVPSGIADFRSPGGLWSIYSPEEYATLSVFRTNPEKAWLLYRALGKALCGKIPNKAHHALAEPEKSGLLHGTITQNVDHLHHRAGSTRVYEMHGDHHHLHCLWCGNLIPVVPDHYEQPDIPHCDVCGKPLKPHVVLFGEAVRHMDTIERALGGCDILMIIGTSAQVYPAAFLPELVTARGGNLWYFNTDSPERHHCGVFYFHGDVASTLPRLVASLPAAH